MALMLTAMYYKLPWANYGGGWINDRVHLYIFLVLLPFFDLGGVILVIFESLAPIGPVTIVRY